MYTLRIQADPFWSPTVLFYSTCRCRERMPVPNCFAATCSHSQFGGLRTMGGQLRGKHSPPKLGPTLSALHEGEPPHCLRSISNTFHWLGWDAIPILNHQTRPQPAPHNGIQTNCHELPIVVYKGFQTISYGAWFTTIHAKRLWRNTGPHKFETTLTLGVLGST